MTRATKINKGLIQKKVLIQASPEAIYKALTDARELVKWFCDRAVCDPRVGGQLKAYWRCGKSIQQGRAKFTRVVPESLVELRWVDDGRGQMAGKERHILSYAIRPGKHSSEVVIRDEGYPPPDEETLAVLDQGWIGVLRDLKDHCEAKERAVKRRQIRHHTQKQG